MFIKIKEKIINMDKVDYVVMKGNNVIVKQSNTEFTFEYDTKEKGLKALGQIFETIKEYNAREYEMLLRMEKFVYNHFH